jgi:hypothetical protein
VRGSDLNLSIFYEDNKINPYGKPTIIRQQLISGNTMKQHLPFCAGIFLRSFHASDS